jgi:hypothetical protein
MSGKAIRTVRDGYVQALLALEDTAGCTFANIARLAEIDAALALGMDDDALRAMMTETATNQSGHDLIRNGVRYQVKARRMGRRGNIASVFQFRHTAGFDCAVFVMYSARLEVMGMVAVERSDLLKVISGKGATTWDVVRRVGRALV